MRSVLTDPNASDEQKFQTWRDAMSPEISDDEVRDLMQKAHTRMQDFTKPKVKAKKEKVVAEMDKSQKSPAGWNLDDYDYSKGKWTRGKIVTAKDAVKDMGKELNRAFNNTDPKKKKPGVAEGFASMLAKAVMPAEKTLATKPLVSRVPPPAGPLKPGEIPPDIRMLINKVQNKVPLRPDEYSKLQAYKAFRDADSMSLKEANMLARALREGSAGKLGKGGTKTIDKEKKAAMTNATTLPGLNMSTGSMYMNYRMGIALAGAPTFPTKIEADNWIGGDPLISSYTQEEFEMVKAAAKQVGAGTIQNWTGKRSEEIADVNKTSTVAKIKRNKYGI
jgi:hypothetical protein